MPASNIHSGPYKDSWFRRYLTLAAVATLKNIRPRASSVKFLTPWICVKYGTFEHLSEGASMRYIASHTSIPVPKVYCAFEKKGITYVVMSRIKGSPIGHEWEQRSEESRASLLAQLKKIMEEMRSIDPQNTRVEGVDGGQLFDIRLPSGGKGFGPFDSVGDFHSFLRNGMEASSEQIPEVNELVEQQNKTQFSTCFTHGDLNSTNILVRRDEIVGIVDWDTAGWYPEYWEDTSAYNVNPYNEFWRDEINNFLIEYPEARAMEQLRQKYFGAF